MLSGVKRNAFEELFGAAFQEYKKQVPAFMPRLSTFHEPETYSVNPAAYRRASFDALWFVWIGAIFELLEGMKEIGLLKSLWSLY